MKLSDKDRKTLKLVSLAITVVMAVASQVYETKDSDKNWTAAGLVFLLVAVVAGGIALITHFQEIQSESDKLAAARAKGTRGKLKGTGESIGST